MSKLSCSKAKQSLTYNFFRGHRISQGMTIPQVAERGNVPRGRVSEIENGHFTNPTIYLIRRIAKAYDLPFMTVCFYFENKQLREEEARRSKNANRVSEEARG